MVGPMDQPRHREHVLVLWVTCERTANCTWDKRPPPRDQQTTQTASQRKGGKNSLLCDRRACLISLYEPIFPFERRKYKYTTPDVTLLQKFTKIIFIKYYSILNVYIRAFNVCMHVHIHIHMLTHRDMSVYILRLCKSFFSLRRCNK